MMESAVKGHLCVFSSSIKAEEDRSTTRLVISFYTSIA